MPTVHPARSERVFVVDEANMMRLWLEEKIAQHELTPAEADKQLQEYEGQGKTWVGPFKDSLGGGRIIYKLARDMKSWRGARVYFIKGKTGDLVIIKDWPVGRKLLPGTRYKVTNPKIVELQIGKPGLRAAGRESARFGIWLVVAVDVADYVLRNHATLGQLLGKLTVDVPTVLIASAIGAEAGALFAGTAIIGAVACGPILIALVIGIGVGVALSAVDEHWGLSDKLGEAYDRGLVKLGHVWHELGAEAEQRFKQLENSRMVHDLSADAKQIAINLGKKEDWIRWRLTHL